MENLTLQIPTKKKWLNDVAVIRPLAIFLIVVTHAFTMYNGGWPLPNGVESIIGYKWIAVFLGSFRMQTVIFIGGYVFAFQEEIKSKPFNTFFKIKLKRLILPSIFFSLIYYFLFLYKADSFSFNEFLINILSGSGHMWFLPMLFWCFIASKWLIVLKYNRLYILSFLAVLSVIAVLIPIPFGINRACNYLFYFYLGIYIWNNKDKVISTFSRIKVLVPSMLVFVAILISLTLLNEKIINDFLNSPIKYMKLIGSLVLYFDIFIYSTFGVLLFFLTVNYFIEVKNKIPSKLFFSANAICYGVYIYQQFILQFIYYKTPIALNVNIYILPWLALIITLVISILFAILTLKTKFGKFLIG